MNGYPGSKAGEGVWQRIISQMPPHENYFELFVGHGAILSRKLPAPGLNIGCDIDPEVITWWHRRLKRWDPPSQKPSILQEDALRTLSHYQAMARPKTLVYLDPPYLRSVRTRLIYNCEFHTPRQHGRLLEIITRDVGCMIMISGYPSRQYDRAMRRWRCIEYRTRTRGGTRTECLWMNFPEPTALHDCRFAGEGFREREKIKRMRETWTRRMREMDPIKRQVIREALELCTSTLA